MGLGLLLSGVSGAGHGLASSAQEEQKVYDEQALMAERSRLEEERQLRIAEAGRVAARQAGIQQGQQIGAAVRQTQNERDAAAINATNGSDMTAADADVLRSNPEARKAYGLLDATRKSDLEDRGNAAESLGYLDAARESRNMLQTEVINNRNEANDATANRRADAVEAHNATMEIYQQRREDRLDRLAESTLSFNKARAGKEDARADQVAENSQRQATAIALRGVSDDIKSLEKEAANPMLAPEQSKIVQQQLTSARSEAARYRTALAGAGLDGSTNKSPDKPFNPGDFSLPGKGVSPAAGNPAPSNSVDSSEPRNLKSPAQIAEEDARMAAMNRVSGGNSRRADALAGRSAELATGFDSMLAKIQRGASRSDVGQALDWFDEHQDQMSNSQLKQLRDARRSAGL